MAICEMSSMSLIGLKSDRSDIFDALVISGAAQIRKCGEYGLEIPADGENYSALSDSARKALSFAEAAYDELGDKTLPPVVKDGFGVGVDEFLAFGEKLDEVKTEISEILSLSDRCARLKTELYKIEESRKAYADYENLKEKFSFYTSTRFVNVYFGVVPSDKTAALIADINAEDNAEAEISGGAGSKNVVTVVCMKECSAEVENLLTKASFSKCPYTEDITAKDKLSYLDGEIKRIENEIKQTLRETVEKNPQTKDIKTYIDYFGFLTEKDGAKKNGGETTETFLAEAYVPTEAVARVDKELKEKFPCIYTEYKEIPRDEFAPTLMKNNKVVENFEAVTNMYSAPAYGALDPNGVMSFFFSLFMGVIMADAGYGLLMILGGFLLAAKSREGTSIKRMAKVFAYGGFFAVAFGVLMDSFLGFSILRNIPAYAEFYNAYVDPIAAKATIAGITVPSALLWCLGLGTFQISVSLIMKAVQCFKRGQVVEGIFSGLVWSFALVCFILTVFFTASGNTKMFGYFVYPTIGLFALGILTSGITEKGFGKVTKVFGAAYGLINYASDILSYARLYGLMLAGAQIASIFTNSIAVEMLFPLGIGGIIGGILVIVLGNVFNLAMSLLGAYIHDSRLQYVEFFGRFYEGEGELFTPLGSEREFIYLKN